jgi:hypothetical protein
VYVGTLQPHSETFKNIKVLKTSNYAIAAQVRACSYCTFLRIKLGDSLKEFSIKNELTENDLVRDKLFYFTTNLTAGNNDLRVYSDGEVNLYKVIVYPNNSGLALSPHSETFRNIKVLKTSNYTIAAQATTCKDCTFLRIKLGDSIKTFSLKNNQTQDKWFYFTTNLTAGNNDLRIYSDGKTNLYKVIIYSDSYKNETLSDLFDPKKASAAVLSFDKIDPSHYQARVNATKPFVLKFTGPYKPAWTAYVNGKQYGSVELYPFEAKANDAYNLYTDTNGFFIPETGELSIKIEYQSQKWFYVGSLVTISTILGSVCYLALERREAIRRLLKIVVSGKPRLIWQYFSQQIGNKNEHIENEYSINTAGSDSVSSNDTDKGLKTSKKTYLGDDDDLQQPKLTKYRDIMILKLNVHSFIKPEFPIFIALVILLITPFLLVQQQEFFANELMVYAYVLLVVGAIWLFVLYLKNIR